MTPGDRIRTARIRAGFSQAALAARLGVASGTVGRWERGKRVPDAGEQDRALGVCRHRLDLVAVAVAVAEPKQSGCPHRLQLVDAATGDAECADCGAIARWPANGECAEEGCTWPQCLDGGCDGPLGEGGEAVWEVPGG